MRTIFLPGMIALVLFSGCQTIARTPRFAEKVISTDTVCDETSTYDEVRLCSRLLANKYVEQAESLDVQRTGSGIALIVLSAAGAGAELFKQSRDITRTAGLGGGLITAFDTYRNPKAVANILSDGHARLECALTYVQGLDKQLEGYVSAYDEMNKAIGTAKAAVAVTSGTEKALLNSALDNIKKECEGTAAYALMTETDHVYHKDQAALALELYAVVTSISASTTRKIRNGLGDVNTTVATLKASIASFKTAAADANGMTASAEQAKTASAAVTASADATEAALASKNVDKKGTVAATAAAKSAAASTAKAAEAANELANSVDAIALSVTSLKQCATAPGGQ